MHLSSRLRLAPLGLALIAGAAMFVGGTREASALMQLEEAEGGGGGGYYAPPPPPPTYNKIVYLHGRSMNTWPSYPRVVASSAWNHVSLYYNGSDRLTSYGPRTTVKNAIRDNCTGSNQCVIVCYSAGCARMLLAFDDLIAEGTPANRVAWITAAGSAAGGSEVADKATRWWVKLLAKIFGGSAAIDDDLRVGTMRGTFGFIQNRAPVPMYHLAGSRDMCRKVAIFFKMCGNSYLPGRLGDGAVPPHSACGYASSGYYGNCGVAAAKFTNRQAQQAGLYYSDHVAIVGDALYAATVRLGSTATISVPNFGALSSEPDANETYEDADEKAENPAQITNNLSGDSTDPSVVTTHTCQDGYCDSMSSSYAQPSGGGSGSGDPRYSTLQQAY
jgi:hypothetical protein